jgi:hypothetical protein
MKFDFQQAFSYMKNDKKLAGKLFVGGLFMSVPILLQSLVPHSDSIKAALISYAILCMLMFLSAFPTGFFQKTTNERIHGTPSELPDWINFGKIFVIGLKSIAGCLLYMIPGYIVIFVLGILAALSIYNKNIVLLIIPILLIVPIIALMLFFAPLMQVNFAKDLKILSYVNFSKAFAMLKGNIGSYLLLIAFFAVISLVMLSLSLFFSFKKLMVLNALLPFVSFYFVLVNADLSAQFVKMSKQE